jgi:biopolymer transport protein ExbD
MAVIKKTATKKARIEIIPLIDVIFFLLATFVLFTLSLNKLQSIPIELPQATTARPDEVPQVTTLQVSAEGTVYLDKESISIEELPRRLAAIKQSKGDPRVLIAGDSRASYGDAIRVLDMVHLADIDKVSIQTTVATGK